jgi:23S rRNA pseudouridine1911/1915/1917 synthase
LTTKDHSQRSERGDCVAVAGKTLAAILREHMPERSWQNVRALCASGKVTVDGRIEVDPAFRLAGGEPVAWDMARPDPRRRALRPGFRIVFEDGHLIVIEKPEGVSTVPFERKETGTALDLVRDAWRRNGKRATTTPLYVVHRIDKDTSGLVCFAKTKLAERGLHRVFKNHLADREYLAVAQGTVREGRIESRLVDNRGDGLRGSTRRPGEGQHAITNVEVVERFSSATLCRVRLQTGRTHQIRIHLAEQGNPLVGETVYIRDLLRKGGKPIKSKRLLLHAATLGFEHPVTGERLHFVADAPPELSEEIAKLRGRRKPDG